ncbi:MAG: hypothetical protein U1D67_10635 [Dehalococcoidia bacterium]|nr:hypothetical protein [Dehalococcoidia bacterium]MDZ4247557.1 hypothetical protein [Dehalococcoidia bacterium]
MDTQDNKKMVIGLGAAALAAGVVIMVTSKAKAEPDGREPIVIIWN